MGRRVKCQVTGEYGNSDDFVKVGSKYYKSQEVYDEFQRESELRRKIIHVISVDILGYESGQVFPTILVRRLKELNFYPNEVILETVQNLQDSLLWAMQNKDFRSDVNRIEYIFAAIKNHINDVYKRYKVRKNAANHETVIGNQLSDFANMTVEKPKKQKNRDISWAFDNE